MVLVEEEDEESLELALSVELEELVLSDVEAELSVDVVASVLVEAELSVEEASVLVLELSVDVESVEVLVLVEVLSSDVSYLDISRSYGRPEGMSAFQMSAAFW